MYHQTGRVDQRTSSTDEATEFDEDMVYDSSIAMSSDSGITSLTSLAPLLSLQGVLRASQIVAEAPFQNDLDGILSQTPQEHCRPERLSYLKSGGPRRW